jgi:hypothetical protein
MRVALTAYSRKVRQKYRAGGANDVVMALGCHSNHVEVESTVFASIRLILVATLTIIPFAKLL